ncbi:protein kinase [Pichia kluyveri]|uniref:Serine/threonine-protein kinase RIO2 n=1 Tax=Pichia kluyveri TaxID=36015 RepID=A0AAV5R818_PICKL|nr:protein kinase [Pichia kluyveri]
MKLDTTYMRYLTPDDWRVLQAVEKGSHNHEVVPTKLIGQIANLKSGIGNTNKAISDLAKINLISRLRNASYDGYRITYNGFDYVALKTIHQHGNIEELEHTIGVGKESDIYSCKTKNGEERVLKIHRLGRISFRTVRNKRDYLKIGKGGSWMFLSTLAAQREYEFMSILYRNEFEVPIPFDVSRHLILMERIKGFPMTQLYELKDIGKLYNGLMKFAVKLANNGLIHCDYNEYNIMIINKEESGEDDKDRDFVVIDFPQCISIEHPDAKEYFKRDIECIKKFFKRRFGYKPMKIDEMMLDDEGFGKGYKYGWPIFERDIKRINDLDVQVKASGYRRKLGDEERQLQAVVGQQGDDSDGEDEGESDYSDSDDGDYDSDYSDYSEDNGINEEEEENERIIEAISSGVGNLKMDALGNYILEEGSEEEEEEEDK